MAKKKIAFDLELDFQLLGVVAPIPNHKMLFIAENYLDLSFERLADIRLPNKSKTSYINFFVNKAEIPEYENYILLIANHSGNEYFLPEMPKFDFFIKTDSALINAETIINILKKSNDIITIVPIELYSVKNLQRFYFEEKPFDEDES